MASVEAMWGWVNDKLLLLTDREVQASREPEFPPPPGSNEELHHQWMLKVANLEIWIVPSPGSNKVATSPLLQWCQKKSNETESVNKSQCPNIIPQMSRLYYKITHHIKNQKDLKRIKKIIYSNSKMTKTLDLSDKHFKADMIKMLQWTIMNMLETSGKLEILSEEIVSANK